MIGEEVNQSISENSKFLNIANGSSTNADLEQTSSKKIQNYVQFRSAEYQRMTNHFHKPYSLPKKPANSTRLYMRNRINMKNEGNTQEYGRYRNSTYHPPTKINPFLVPCYIQLTKQNENEYSRYRDSRSSRKNSRCEYYIKLHQQCRTLTYDKNALRFPVPDERVFWNIIFPDYTPIEYTTEKILHNPKADPIDPSKIDKFNQIDKKIDRRSFTGHYYVDPVTHRPQNPIGRTGRKKENFVQVRGHFVFDIVTGRGRLYHWGPNHAGDPVVTRWLRDENNCIVHRRMNAHDRSKPVLEFVAIQRQDTKQWALPGGMVDPGEQISETVKREFQEEAMKDGGEKSLIEKLFSNGQKLYEYYVDDPRNTDNAWLETVAVHFHDETGQLTINLHLDAGDDAEKVVWCPVDRKLELYACHKEIIKVVVDRLDAYW